MVATMRHERKDTNRFRRISARWSSRQPRRLLVVVLAILVGAAATLVARRDPAAAGCVSDSPLFAFTTAARKLRQTDVATFRAGRITRVTTDQLSHDPSFSPDGGRVVFSSGRDGEFDPELGYDRLALFTASSAGGDEERLTSGVYDHQPDWSPDGSKVVFVRSRFSRGQDPQLDHPMREELWTVDIDTKQTDLLLRAPSRRGDPYRFHSPVWSPDGSQIAFSRAGAGAHGLWLMGADGSNAREIMADTGVSYFDSPGLAWSPDGEELAWHGGTAHGAGVVIMRLDDGSPRLLATGSEWPAWSPEGSRIAYFEFQPPDNGFQLILRNTRGDGESPVRTVEGPVSGLDLDWACTRAGEAPPAVPTPPEAGVECDGVFQVVHRSIRPGDLLRVDITPSGEGWAVGQGGVRLVRFDEESYEVVANVPPAGGDVYLSDISAPESDDAFVAGSQKSRRWQPVVLRWNGDEWARMNTPRIQDGFLKGIVALAPDDVWAVGFRQHRLRSSSLILHFDGTNWARVDVPSSGRTQALMAVGASSAANVWAIGQRGRDGDRAVVLHYNGSHWSEVDLPERISSGPARLSAVEVISPNDVWIVGTGGGSSRSYLPALALHFDGLRWESDPILGAGVRGSLSDVEATGPRDVWAVGHVGSIGLEATAGPLALRRRDSWRRVAIEDPRVGGEFAGLAADHRGDIWAVGEKAGSDWVIQRACMR
jgi:hypothetical protein